MRENKKVLLAKKYNEKNIFVSRQQNMLYFSLLLLLLCLVPNGKK